MDIPKTTSHGVAATNAKEGELGGGFPQTTGLRVFKLGWSPIAAKWGCCQSFAAVDLAF
jgi:hypothetical protein